MKAPQSTHSKQVLE